MVTLGMMCHVLTVTTTLVLKVLSVARFITLSNINDLHVPDSESQQTCNYVKKGDNTIKAYHFTRKTSWTDGMESKRG